MKGKIFLCAVLFLVFAPVLSAQETKDLSLSEIDLLIKRTEYDEALKQLNVFIEKNPEKFDSAQIRIKKIMNARNQYSILAERLIKLIQTDPGNNKEIYEITAQLEKFERHPSDQNLRFIADLKKSAEFNYFRAVFLEIQNETAKKAQSGDYVGAVEKTKEGFWLYRDNFYEQWEQNPEITGAVNKTLSELDRLIAEFEEKNYLPKINNAVNDFIRAVNQEQYETSVARFSDVESLFKNYAQLRNAIIGVGTDLQNQFEEIKKIDLDSTDASFLPFMFRFVFGIDSVKDSGILGAVDCLWNTLAGKMNEAVYATLLKKYSLYETAINDTFVAEVKRFANLDKKVLGLYDLAKRNEDLQKSENSAGAKNAAGPEKKAHNLENPYTQYFALSDYAINLSEGALRLSNIYAKVQSAAENQKKSLAQVTGATLTLAEQAQIIKNLFESNTALAILVGERSSQELSEFAWTAAYKNAAAAANRSDFEGLSTLYTNTLASIFEETAEILQGSWQQITSFYMQSSDQIVEKVLAYYNSADIYRAGFFTKIPQNTLSELRRDISKSLSFQDSFNANPELDFGITYSYPDISLSISDYTQQLAQNSINTFDNYKSVILENFNAHKQKYSSEVETLVVKTNDYLEQQKKKLETYINGAKEQGVVARRQMTAAQLARNEADLRFNEAQNALKKDDFDTARKKLQDSLSKYDESLNNQNDEVLRAETDKKLQALGESIAKAENEIVVREVRDLKTKAKDAYFNGRFDDAEKYLNQAKIRWAVTNVNEDEEITNLLNFVNTAISMKTGREILPSAPQYPEMSQLLNIAYQYFDEGSRKIGEGNRSEGEVDLNRALESIQKLQYVYPLNQEASILTLRINRLLDPQKFSEEFSQKVEMAKMMCKSKDTQQEGYANLLDYYELDPNYKGLKDLIYQVEIDIGIRAKPVSNSGATRAKNLVAEAKRIYNSAGNDSAKLKNALSKIDEALALVSDNEEAMALKDKITTKIGGNTATVLSTEDERLYQLAIQRLQNNNIVGANAIVEQLLRKPSNANSQKIKDLKNKIEARS
ncbi:MAG: hypothetical protein J6X84_01780 [Treponema sp.]|nr:hypothetical protein [Treponema sp.]